ncbi:CBS domain-containing protein [Candidatus Sumerlaeota bacterium]|nr:CBS domain-containing protein [Candidatus Sumerlaeota bacterium]
MTKVRDLLDKKGSGVVAVARGDSVLRAAQIMNENRIGSVVVTEGDSVVGIFTERDILIRVVAAQRDPERVAVEEVMTSPVACCRLDTSLSECRGVITERRIRHLPVVEEGHLVGIITSGDLIAIEMAEKQRTIEDLHEYIFGPSRVR